MKNDWTSISDIGKHFDDGILTQEKYQFVEDAYVRAVQLILEEKDVSELTLLELEKSDGLEEYLLSSQEKTFFERMTDASHLDIQDVETAVRLILREIMWGTLTAPAKTVQIEFGYDYYMYVRCEELLQTTQEKIADCELYVEEIGF